MSDEQIIRGAISGTQVEELRAILPTEQMFQQFFKRAMVVAAQKAVKPTKTGIQVQLGLPKQYTDRRVFVNQQSDLRPYTQIKISGRAFAFYTFRPAMQEQGVLGMIAGKEYGSRHAFIARGPTRGWHVWERVIQPWRSTKGQGLQGWEEQKMKLRIIKGASPKDAYEQLPDETAWIARRLNEEIPTQLDSQISRAMAVRAKRMK